MAGNLIIGSIEITIRGSDFARSRIDKFSKVTDWTIEFHPVSSARLKYFSDRPHSQWCSFLIHQAGAI